MIRTKMFVPLLIAAGSGIPTVVSGQANSFNDTLLTKARAAASMVPGDLPLDVRYLKFAGASAPMGLLVETTQDSTVAGALTVFQIRYPRGWIMVDAGMAKDVNPKYSFVPGGLDRVREALRDARLILVTHEHDDHVA